MRNQRGCCCSGLTLPPAHVQLFGHVAHTKRFLPLSSSLLFLSFFRLLVGPLEPCLPCHHHTIEYGS